MAIIKNSAKCTACDVEIESKGVHDFVVHFCLAEPTAEKIWTDDNRLVDSGETTWRFAVDGGRAYIRRAGFGFTDTSVGAE